MSNTSMPEGGEWWHDENGWVYLVSNEEGRDNYETVGHIDLLDDCAEIVRIHNASLKSAVAAATDRERERDADRVAYTSMNLHSYLHSKIRSRKVEVKQDAVEDEWEYQREYER